MVIMTMMMYGARSHSHTLSQTGPDYALDKLNGCVDDDGHGSRLRAHLPPMPARSTIFMCSYNSNKRSGAIETVSH